MDKVMFITALVNTVITVYNMPVFRKVLVLFINYILYALMAIFKLLNDFRDDCILHQSLALILLLQKVLRHHRHFL